MLDHDTDLDLTEYFTESEDEDLDDPKWRGRYTNSPLPISSKLTGMEVFYSDSEDDDDNTGDNNTPNVDINNSLTLNLTSESAYEGDISTYATNTPPDTRPKRTMKKHRLAPILRTSYYDQKRLMTGKRHFV